MVTGALFLMLIAAAPPAQAPGGPDRFEAFRFFLGAWEGEGEGKPGKSRVSREYALVLDGRRERRDRCARCSRRGFRRGRECASR